MKTFSIQKPVLLNWWTRLLRRSLITGLLFVLAIPAFTFSQTQQSTVNLGFAEGFAVLAGSLVSSIPTSAITGDVGLSPATGSNISGLTEQEVHGIIYTVDASGPAGSVANASFLTAAQGSLTIAYNDIVGRTPVPTGTFLNPGSGNMGGLTLVPGLYKFTSSASITGSDLTLSGSASDVWIFQIAAELNVGNDIQVILGGGANPSNIFWQVGTSATFGTNSVFKGTVLADQSISLNTGAAVDGRLLASIAAVTLASNVVTKPEQVTSVENLIAPKEFALFQNYPNPFNPTTNIRFTVPVNGHATLKIFSTLGEEVATLFNGEAEAGKFIEIKFNASDLATGVYFSRLEQSGKVQTKKLMLIK